MSSDPITGLTRRPGTDLVNKLITSADVRGWHDFRTKDGRKFIAAFYSNTVKVYDLNGVEQTVVVNADTNAYIALAGDLRFSTIDNDTFVVNRSKVALMKTAVKTYVNRTNRQAFIVQVLGGQYGRNYNVAIDGVIRASLTIANGSVATDIDQTRTKYIANQLYTQLNANLSGAGWHFILYDDLIFGYIDNTNVYTINVNDDYGNTNIKACGMTVSRTEDLPRFAPHNYVVRVAAKSNPDTDLWFRFIVDGFQTTTDIDGTAIGLFGRSGYWQECVAPGVPYQVDDATMPHIMDYNPLTDTFTFRRGVWADRQIGTLVSNPDPTFMNAKITDVGSFQGRTVLLSGPNVIMSRTNRSGDFWFGSASAQAATDPIDIRSKIEASTMQSIVQHNKDLVIFSNKGQFVINGSTNQTPANAALVLSSAFEAELRAKPASAGRNVFFAINFGSYTGMREFYVESGTNINDSRGITQHVKQYLEGRITYMAASSNYDTLLVATDASAGNIYQYQYIWNNQEKVQSAWSKLLFGKAIVHTFFDVETVYYVMKDGNDHYLLRMSLDVQPAAYLDYHVHLDQRFDATAVSRQFVLPYPYLKDMALVAVQGFGCPTPGLTAPIESIVYNSSYGWVVTLKNDMHGGDIIVGVKYRSAYIPTMPIIKDADNVKVGTGNLTLTRFLVNLANTGEVIGHMLSDYGNGPQVRFNGRLVGGVNNVVGEQPLSNEVFSMPIHYKADLCQVGFFTDSHLPMTFLDIEWEGQYSKRGKRIQTGGK